MEKEIISDDIKKTLKDTFKNLKNDVPIEVYTKKGTNDPFNEATVNLIKTISELTTKVKASFFTVGDTQSEKRKVFRSPTVLIDPDKYKIRITGSPLGEEGRSLIVAILMASTSSVVLSEESVRKLMELKDPREIQVYVSPT